MNIAGIDVSTKAISMVILDGSNGGLLVRIEYWIAPNNNKAERCRDIWTHPYVWELKEMRVRSVYVEQPMGTYIKGVAEVERVVGSVLAATPEGIAVSLIGPSEWKRKVGLPGNASKDAVAAHANALYPDLQDASQDLHDAALIARACFIESAEKEGT